MSFSRSLAIGLVAATVASAASAANLVTNGSFETPTPGNGLAGWTYTGGENPPSGTPLYPPVSIFYGAAQAYPQGAFGEAIPANNAPTNSPDAVGARAAYFVSDFANNPNQTLTQSVFLNAGIYQIGFSAYAPANGFANAGDATFEGIVASLSLASYNVSAGLVQTWQTFAGAANIAVAGIYDVEFTFYTNAFPSKDIVIDQVYIIAGNPPIGVPEPLSLALLGSGLLGLAAARRLRRRA
ncbi:PEP-CTERM sorting domain-containing protein [Elioraea sp.]|uniref:PEP-CTERM sorting domain-containing protein n=1 Tax=Elioraea sp. TaxID=2185103 RepID=UPI0025C6D52D|nr:PEP-CTERM sorting domain-containing protein [Elioraea sp.]